jgi:polar amino acid transport system ATP-binding protein
MRLLVILVTHDLGQARRLSRHLVFLDHGRVVETGPTARLFEAPAEERTREYVSRGNGRS